MIITNLLTNMIILTLWGNVPTNTPAFQSYTLTVLDAKARVLGAKWGLETNRITTNKITHFEATPGPHGFRASVTYDDRYVFGTESGSYGFTDKAFYPAWQFSSSTNIEEANRVNDAVVERWLHSTNLLTLKIAQQVAEAAMLSAGLPINELGFGRPKEKTQMVWKDYGARSHESNGWIVVETRTKPVVSLLPYYEFRWEGFRNKECKVQVSVISGKLAHFDFDGPDRALEKPINYLELLGLPPNTVFVGRRFTSPPTYELSTP